MSILTHAKLDDDDDDDGILCGPQNISATSSKVNYMSLDE